MKTIIVAILVAMAVKPVDVETFWRDAKTAFTEYRFEDAITLTDQYLENQKHDTKNDAACRALRQRAELAGEMMQAVEDVTILDSVKCAKARFLEAYDLKQDVGRLKTVSGGVSFTTGRGDRSIKAERDGSQFDLWLLYSDGESRKLSDVVNTSANENYPYELSDGVTLYFASDGRNSIGGYDLYMTRYNNETFEYSEPMHIGMPFNSIYNDYMMVIDELKNVGWFATDRYQKADTVVVYKFKVAERKRILPDEVEPEVRIATAQLKRYSMGYDHKDAEHPKAGQNPPLQEEKIYFVINDTLIYNNVTQFRDSASLKMYGEMQELERNMKLRSVIMEGKKREFSVTEDEADRQTLKREILEDEEFLESGRDKIAALTKAIRRQEIMAITK